ncbi:MAG TPA: glycosyl hydrolase family 18 protein, partial [Nonomuraea sp.]|nr:glycosyl hydrolase family 18 protein [Nonomuraea sp.]
AAPIGPSGLRREVFGFLPYWQLTDSGTTLDWQTLSTVAYFSVGCRSNGYLDKYDADGTTTTGWGGWTSSRMTSIINAAHQNQTRVVLTISCFAWSGTGASHQAALLGSATARGNLARSAAAAIRDRGADGINLDFEPIVAGYSEEFTLLVRAIRSELNKIAPGYQLTFDTLGSIGNQPIAEATAPGGADAVFIMGYDYRTASSSVAGSISPLTGPRYDLNDTVKAYTAKISPSKVILGVPYYGRAWSTSTDRLNATSISGTKYGGTAEPTYSQAFDLVAQNGRRWDAVEQAPWTAYRKQTCTSTYGCVTSWRELYYDDAASLKLRYDLVNRASLRGAGIWALGYDGTHPELRQAIADKFLSDRSAPLAGITTLAQTQRDEGFRVGWSSWDDSPVTSYDVQVATDAGPWTPWLTGTPLLSSIYLGENGRSYAFRIRATDIHGNVGAWNGAVVAGATAVPATIIVGGFANVLVNGLHMRSAPATGGAVMATLAAGDALQVIGGPVLGEGYTWYQVSGPVRQWSPVDAVQVGGWVAVSGNGVTNAAPRRPPYATRVAAGITDVHLNGGGGRFLTPNGDGDHDTLHLAWTNQRTFDSLALRVFRLDGTLVGSVALAGVATGGHAYDWDGRLSGVKVPAGGYVLQLQGTSAGSTFTAPSASPVSQSQIALTGIMVGDAAPTAVLAFGRPASPNRAGSLAWHLTFGGPIAGLTAGDFARTGTATGCVIASPTGAGATWTVTLTGCSAGTVNLGLKPGAVVDTVRNWGPAAQVNAQPLLIDRTAPSAATPRLTLRVGVNLASTSSTAGLPAFLTLAGSDPGGAGIRSYDVRRSVNGGAFTAYATAVTTTSLAVTLTPGRSYRFQARARDNAGNVGA